MKDKKFKLPKEQYKQLIEGMGACLASDKITVDGLLVGFMYREEPQFDVDSGWRFFQALKIRNTSIIPTI